jgi:hypothetical protein
MDYTRYSKSEFEKRGHGSEQAFELARDLQKDVLHELRVLVEPRMREIAEELKKLGHDLSQEGNDYPGDICFREVGEQKNRPPGLIFGVYLVISTGYPNTLKPEDIADLEAGK